MDVHAGQINDGVQSSVEDSQDKEASNRNTVDGLNEQSDHKLSQQDGENNHVVADKIEGE